MFYDIHGTPLYLDLSTPSPGFIFGSCMRYNCYFDTVRISKVSVFFAD